MIKRIEITKDIIIIKGDAERLHFCNHDYKGIDKIALKNDIISLLNNLVARNPGLRYYQGLHDIASGFLMVLDLKPALLALETVCKYYL